MSLLLAGLLLAQDVEHTRLVEKADGAVELTVTKKDANGTIPSSRAATGSARPRRSTASCRPRGTRSSASGSAPRSPWGST
jgi:hypothetical protein